MYAAHFLRRAIVCLAAAEIHVVLLSELLTKAQPVQEVPGCLVGITKAAQLESKEAD